MNRVRMRSMARVLGGRLLENPSRANLEARMRAFAQTLPDGAVVLDAGAGKSPYRALFHRQHYLSTDFLSVPGKDYRPPDVVADVADVPFVDGCFDAIILNQVLEHVPDPSKVISEAARLLHDGGKLFYSAPLFYEEHELPYDFFRYTREGVQLLLRSNGLVPDFVCQLESYYGTLAYQMRYAARHLPVVEQNAPRRLRLILAAPAALLKAHFGVLSIVFGTMERRYAAEDGVGMPKNYVAVATKQ